MKYKSPFTKEIIINNSKEAKDVIMTFCDFCLKDSIGQFHCSGADALLCQDVKNKIAKQWLKQPHTEKE